MEITVEQLYDFKACPLRYKFIEIDKMPVKLSQNDGLREAIKTTISYFYLNLHQGKLVSMEDLKAKFGSIWYDKNKIYDIQFDDKQAQRKKELAAIEMLAIFHRQQKFNPDKVIAVNVDFRVPIGDDFFVRGNIPVIRETTRGLEIANFKTSPQRPDDFWQRTDMDLTLQAIGFHSMFKKEPDSICLQHLKTGVPYYTERRQKDYQRLYKSVRMMKKTIDEEWFYPRESYHCDSCPAKSFCMEWR
ncbi:PD-(D/E)XK nuclease superfamily protein [Paenibacillus sp. UNC496MF]|uniref:PD-(D/E)XK nuclease family protein n=1 Tax=Paenibacillus sp. UNC496MF TaxID=1502753 RepID=UPI0008E23B6D|nr:PD-(D/E)XK nuclease family protein [Paenibacillus sp. UNC496MF]SFJ65241.1 PD-(D/E)XK nuclease superfamily protein [Paenibacillus sp. UNC496MF]